MQDETRIYEPVPEEEELALDEVLEPYENVQEPEYSHYDGKADYGYDDGYEDEEPDEDAVHAENMRTAAGVFNTISILVGVVVILALVAMLLSLFTWLWNDVTHSLTLLQGGIQ